jgi:hypothetical protein
MTDAVTARRVRAIAGSRSIQALFALDIAALHQPGAADAPRWCKDWFLW